MRNNNRLPYKGRDNLDIDKTEFSYPSLGDTVDDFFTAINDRIEGQAMNAFTVIFYVGIAYGVWCFIQPVYVGVMGDIETAAVATSRTTRATTILFSDVGVFVGEVWLPLSMGAIFYRILRTMK
jgi:hypothetical protein